MENPMNYCKASGLMLARKFLPNVTPFTDIAIVKTVEEWEEIKCRYGDRAAYRTDMLLGAPRKNIISGTNGLTDKIPWLIQKVNAEDSGGAVLVMNSNAPIVPRYAYDGGFNVLFVLGESVTIEVVGEGFDGHELTSGLARHEVWTMHWQDIVQFDPRCPEVTLGRAVYWRVSENLYDKQRKERMLFLCSDELNYEPSMVVRSIPETYTSLLETSLIRQLLSKVVSATVRQQSSLKFNKLYAFGVQGNFVRGDVQVWEIFCPNHWAS